MCCAQYFPSYSEGLSLRQHGHSWLEEDEGDFPSFWEGLSLRLMSRRSKPAARFPFPFLFGRAIIEAGSGPRSSARRADFPSLLGGGGGGGAGPAPRASSAAVISLPSGKTRSRTSVPWTRSHQLPSFPFLLGRAFIEAWLPRAYLIRAPDFPSFWEGLSLR